jgi:hypothetical protein
MACKDRLKANAPCGEFSSLANELLINLHLSSRGMGMKKYISSLVVFALSCAVFIPATKVYSQGRGKASALYAPDKIIVKLKQSAETIADSAYVSDMVLPLPKSGVDSGMSQEQGGIFTLDVREGLSVEEAIRLAQSDPRVEYAEPDYYLYPSASPNDTHFSHIWGLSNSQTQGADISALQAWDITTGSDTVRRGPLSPGPGA